MKIDPQQLHLNLNIDQLVVIKATGNDVIKFLNDQFTNDINSLEENAWQFSGYCSAKGRLIAIMRLFKRYDAVFMLVPRSIAEDLIKRLQIYVFRAKVNFEVVDTTIYAFLGNQSVGHLNNLPGPKQLIVTDNSFILNLSEHSERYLQISNSNITTGNEPLIGEIADLYWRYSEINNEIPTIQIATSEKFIPQHVNFDQIGGISFNKGCFPGQEVVARLHYLGKSKQTMQKLSVNFENKLVAGASIKHPQTEKPLIVVDAVEVASNTFECLVVGQFD